MHAYANIREPRPRAQAVGNPKEPTVRDRNRTKELIEFLKSVNSYESQLDSTKREGVLAHLNEIVQTWCKEVFLAKGYGEDLINEASPKIFTFGSYRLGVHGPGADIDTLCVFPSQVDRRDFFTTLLDKLRGHPDITNIIPIEAAKVPVIAMEFCGIPIDLTCARLKTNTMQEELNLANPQILGLAWDSTDILSLNGPRVTDTILNLVPDRENFRTTLRTIKYWAQSRGIYSNALGFPGGVTWAMLTAYVCQAFPLALPSTILHWFFLVYSRWNWPTPVLLTDIQYGGPLSGEVWKPDVRLHLMPVITPTYPAFNSTFNITESTKRILTKEFLRGVEIMKDEQAKTPWAKLCEKLDFFQEYTIYFEINCISKKEDDLRKLHGLVESRIRFMIKTLDRTEGIEYVHPKMGAVPYTPDESILGKDAKACAFFIGIGYKQGVTTINASNARNEFKNKLTAQMPSDSTVDVKVITKRQLPDWVFPDGKRPVAKRIIRKRPAGSPGAPTNTVPATTTTTSDTTTETTTKTEPPEGKPASTSTTPTKSTPSLTQPTPPKPMKIEIDLTSPGVMKMETAKTELRSAQKIVTPPSSPLGTDDKGLKRKREEDIKDEQKEGKKARLEDTRVGTTV